MNTAFQAVTLLILSTTHARIELSPNCDESLSSSENTTVLYFLTLLPYPQLEQSTSSQPSWNEGPDVLPAAQLAVDHINQDNTTLKGYRIALINVDCGCNLVMRAFLGFVDQLVKWKKQPPHAGRVAGIVGPGCSDSTLAVSQLNNKAEISLLNVHIASSPLLQNRALYRNSFGVLGSSYSIVETIFSLLRENHNKWTHVQIAALYDESRISFYNNYRYFEERLSSEVPSATLIYHSAVYNRSIPISDLKESTARVIVVFTGSSIARQIMCMAYRENIIFPSRQWILTGRTLSDFIKDVEFTYHQENYTCSKEEMQQHALEGNLFINYKLVPIKTNTTRIATTTYEQFLSQYTERVQCYNNYSNYSISPNIWATLLYDAVWSLALAINASITDNETDRLCCTPLGYQCKNAFEQNRLFESGIGDEAGVERVREKLQNLEFRGVSGDIKFSKATGFTSRKININQVINSQEVNIGFSIKGNLTLFDILDVHFIKLTSTYETILTPVFVLFVIITLLQLLAIFFLHMLSLYHWKHPSIKASSPKLNQLIYLGCYLFVFTNLLYTLYKGLDFKHVSAKMCLAQWAWFIPVGFTLVIGTLTVRTWRIYRIFIHFKNPGPFLSDKWLWCFVLVQLSIDVCFGTLWSILDPYRIELSPSEQYVKDGVVIQITKCTVDHLEYWFPFLAVYKSLQLLLLFLLGVFTRHIKNKHFTTLTLRVGAYLLCALYATSLPAYFVFWYVDVEIHIDFAVFCITHNISIFICLVCILSPPILPVFRRK